MHADKLETPSEIRPAILPATPSFPPKELIIQAAALRHAQDYIGALRVIEDNIDLFDRADRISGRLQGFYAARDGGLFDKAHALALQISAEDPSIPSVRAFLAN